MFTIVVKGMRVFGVEIMFESDMIDTGRAGALVASIMTLLGGPHGTLSSL